MNINFIFNRFRSVVTTRIFLLASLWGLGLLWGLFWGISNADSLNISFGSGFSVQPRYFVMFLGICLPVAIAAICIYCQRLVFCVPLVFLEAVSRSVSAVCVCLELGSAAWLLRPILLFPGACSSLVMWWLLLRHRRFDKKRFFLDILLATFVIAAVFLVYVVVLSPPLTRLSIYF